ncbi:MAG TPA: c-type cytochrome domain-containing protein, partial [Isosphaeraceae bacterium]|nr:c-type cytochrome domain-containing protein [Isosphaeraceae bacterium]
MSRTLRKVTVCVTLLASWRFAAREAFAAGTAEGAVAVLQKYCYQCHGKDGRNEGGMNVVTDLKKLVESKRVIPHEPERSKLLRRVVVGDMPPEIDFDDPSESPKPLPRPTPEEIATLRAWIKEGANDTAPKASPRKFVSDLEVLRFISDDLRKINQRERRFTRYFTLTHLANAGYNEDQLQTYRHGLSKLINSLSWNRKIKIPTPIDPTRTVLRVDLRDYLWDEDIWRSILDSYPYG